MPFLHAHQRRVPTQDVYRSVVVCMSVEAAMLAGKDRLALAAFPVYGSALGTGLRRVCGIDFQERPASLGKLVNQQRFKRVPSLIKDGSVQPSFAFDHAAGRGSGHFLYAQILNNNMAKAPRNVGASLMLPISAYARSASRKPSGASKRFGMSYGPAFTSSRRALCRTVSSLNGFECRRDRQAFPGGKHQRVGDAPINANIGPNVLNDCVLNLASEHNVPTERVKYDCYILDCPAHGARVAEFNKPDLWKFDHAPFGIEAPDLTQATGEPERVIDAALARGRMARGSAKEVDECFVEVAQRLLLASLRNVCDPVKSGSQVSQLACLSDVIQRTPVRVLILTPELPSLFQSKIVDQSANARELPKRDLLSIGRLKSISEAAKDHALNLERSQVIRNALTATKCEQE